MVEIEIMDIKRVKINELKQWTNGTSPPTFKYMLYFSSNSTTSIRLEQVNNIGTGFDATTTWRDKFLKLGSTEETSLDSPPTTLPETTTSDTLLSPTFFKDD